MSLLSGVDQPGSEEGGAHVAAQRPGGQNAVRQQIAGDAAPTRQSLQRSLQTPRGRSAVQVRMGAVETLMTAV